MAAKMPGEMFRLGESLVTGEAAVILRSAQFSSPHGLVMRLNMRVAQENQKELRKDRGAG